MIKYLTYLTYQLTYQRVMKVFGLYITFIFIVTAMETSSDILKEERDTTTNRVIIAAPHLYLSGSDISTIFWGPYRHIDEIRTEEREDIDLDTSNLAVRVKQWAEETCYNEKITKISIDVPNNSLSIESLLTSAGFSRKAFVYCLNRGDALNLLQQKEIPTENIYTISSPDSPFLPNTATLYGEFNGAMKVPGLFYACATNLLEKGGKICVHQNPKTLAIDGLISYGCFQNKLGNKSILIDSLFVDPNSRGQGISYRLIKYALNEAFEEGTTMVYWETGVGRTEAQNFYKKFSIDPYGLAYRYMPSKWSFACHFGGDILWNMLPSWSSWS